MENIEQYVQSKLERRYDVLVAIITEKAQMCDSERAKMFFRQFQLEVLNCRHPTICRDTSGTYSKVFIYGVTAYMREEPEYLEKFLKACDSERVTEIIGIRL